MISSKLILFFCFYLLLLDNSLGQRLLVTQVGNKELFKHALEFGKTYGGKLGELGSQWKQLLIQLVQAKRKVGLGKYQLARLDDSATTEEVGLSITDNYTDRVAELVAIRAQDIGTTQKYVDDLEILKNEIALTMIVKMEKTERQFKEKNVRKKVKEAKENGLTDTDIKEILFAEFIDSRGGLSLIDAGASIAEVLLSSFRKGLECILDETCHEKLGIIQYGNGLGDSDSVDGGDAGMGAGVGAGGDPPGGGGDPPEGGGGDPPEGGGGDPPGGGGGDPPGGGGGDSPGGEGDPPGGEGDPPGGGGDPPGGGGGDPDDDENDDEGIDILSEAEERQLLSDTQFSVQQLDRATMRVNSQMRPRRNRIYYLHNEVYTLIKELVHEHPERLGIPGPWYVDFNHEDKLAKFNEFFEHTGALLSRAWPFRDSLQYFRDDLNSNEDLARQNLYYYSSFVDGDTFGIDPSEVPTSEPDHLPEFDEADNNATRYLLSRLHLNAVINIRMRVTDMNDNLNNWITNLDSIFLDWLNRIDEEENHPPTE